MLKPRSLNLLVLTALLCSSAAWAQDTPAGDATPEEKTVIGEVVVTATKSNINKRETGASVTIITEKEIEERGKANVVDLLKDVPGLTIVRENDFGGKANVFIRGAKSGNTLILIDGVESNDPSASDRSFDFANLTADNVERIEVLRGPQSLLYGSDATGGVINIVTKRGKGKPSLSVKAEAGAYSTFRESISVNGGSEDAYYSFAAGRTDTKGFSQAAKAPGATEDPEKDGYYNTTLSSRLGMRVLNEAWLDFSLRYTDAKADLDDGGYADDPNYRAYTKNLSAKASLDQTLAEWWSHNLSFMYLDTMRRYKDSSHDGVTEDVNSWYQGNQKKVEWRNTFTMGSLNRIIAGAEYRVDEVSLYDHSDYGFGPNTSEMNAKRLDSRGLYLVDHLRLFERWFTTAGVRVDDHQEFGSRFTWQANSSFAMPVTGTRLKALYGTGFKAPSIYQLYDPTYGNKGLDPERSTSWEAGIEQPLANGLLLLELTYFNSSYKDMFGMDSMWKTTNIGRASVNGIESAITIKAFKTLSLIASFTYLDTEDRETGEELLRRPKYQAGANLNWAFLPGGNLNLSYTYGGKRDDVWFDAMFTQYDVTLDDYHRLDLYASYWLNDHLQVFGRIDNLTNADFQYVAGYRTTGRSFYAGAKATM
ncbi:MAG: TonB-dependent receptor [Spirochaetota bacterium]|mgnify:CR=1 FL=1|nr:TonB-dependent receptor [Spirochaetota bacterium]OPZ38332.1 MAG: Vitamin B12 transporter BtuB precursor [Spirochaetes bacterium ADurb.BinA120]